MDRLEKFKALSLARADATADIELINRYSVKKLTPEEVYCFSVVLCDNETDRDLEFFSDAFLDAMAPLFCGKTGLSDHRWSAKEQIARLYHVEVEDGKGKNSRKEPLKKLVGSAYMLNSENTQHIVEAIDAGILKEVSVGFAAERPVCSICDESFEWDWKTWTQKCKNDHVKGEKYDGKLCCGKFTTPKDAYEWSFVAVPSQRNAGVTKCCGKCDPDKRKSDCANRIVDQTGEAAFDWMMSADLTGHADKVKLLIPQLQKALIDDTEQKERERILSENEAYMKKYVNK